MNKNYVEKSILHTIFFFLKPYIYTFEIIHKFMALSFKIKKHKITLIGSEYLNNKMKMMFKKHINNMV